MFRPYFRIATTTLGIAFLLVLLSCGGAGGSASQGSSPGAGPAPTPPATPTPAPGTPTPPTGSPAQPSEVVYVSNTVGKSISAFTVDTNSGQLTPVAGSPFAAPFRPLNMDTLANKFLFINAQQAMDSPNTELESYSIDRASGALTLVGRVSTHMNISAEPQVSPSGPWIYILGQDTQDANSNISTFHVNSSGGTAQISGSPFPLGDIADGPMALSPNERFLYMENGFQDGCELLLAHVDPATGLVSGTETASQNCPNEITVAPSGKFVIVVGGLHVYAVGATGQLTEIPGSPFLPNGNAVHVDMDPDGKFVYVIDSGEQKVLGFSMNPTTGALTPVPGSGGSLGSVSVNLDVSRHFVYVTNPNDNTLSVFRFDSATGELTEVPGSPYKVGQAPHGVAAVEF